MFYEYAVEPAVIASWDRARLFLDAFGPWKGRFLARYPKHWKRLVYEGLSCGPVEKKRIEERLALLDRRIFSPRTSATYDGNKTWIENAVAEHTRLPFRAIVATISDSADVVAADDCHEQCDRWRVETGRLCSREAAVFAEMLCLLLRASSRILIIDPYFRADQSEKTEPLAAFCLAVADTKIPVEVHFSSVRSYSLSMQDATRVLPVILPMGAVVKLCNWIERPGGPRLHNRYLLTDVGGVKFGDGIEVGDTGHQDHVSILDEPSRSRLWDQYAGAAPAFDPAGPPQEFVGRRLRQPP